MNGQSCSVMVCDERAHTHNDMHRCLMREGGMTLFHFLFGIEQSNGSGTGGTTTVSSRVIAVRAILCQM